MHLWIVGFVVSLLFEIAAQRAVAGDRAEHVPDAIELFGLCFEQRFGFGSLVYYLPAQLGALSERDDDTPESMLHIRIGHCGIVQQSELSGDPPELVLEFCERLFRGIKFVKGGILRAFRIIDSSACSSVHKERYLRKFLIFSSSSICSPTTLSASFPDMPPRVDFNRSMIIVKSELSIGRLVFLCHLHLEDRQTRLLIIVLQFRRAFLAFDVLGEHEIVEKLLLILELDPEILDFVN